MTNKMEFTPNYRSFHLDIIDLDDLEENRFVSIKIGKFFMYDLHVSIKIGYHFNREG